MCQNVESSISAVKFPLLDLSWLQNGQNFQNILMFKGEQSDIYVLVYYILQRGETDQNVLSLQNQRRTNVIDLYLLGGWSIGLIKSSQKNFGVWGPSPLGSLRPPKHPKSSYLGVLVHPKGEILRPQNHIPSYFFHKTSIKQHVKWATEHNVVNLRWESKFYSTQLGCNWIFQEY